MRRALPLLLAGFLLSSCLGKVTTEPADERLFDTEAYFKKEAERLTAAKAGVVKSAAQDGAGETRVIRDPDWQTELGLFAASMIDKPAWRGKYKTITRERQIAWFTRSPDLRTKMLRIRKRANGEIIRIDIHNATRNILYTTDEWLTWIPDSGYTIRKTEAVRLLSGNRYLIRGKIN